MLEICRLEVVESPESESDLICIPKVTTAVTHTHTHTYLDPVMTISHSTAMSSDLFLQSISFYSSLRQVINCFVVRLEL